MSRVAMCAHWADGIDPILKKLGALAGKSVNGSLIDSYEVGCNNWTPKFREEFMKRRGYDPIPFLPALSGRYVDGGETTERFLWACPVPQRVTFTTWKHWHKDSLLQPSGRVGPVVLRTLMQAPVN